MRYAKNIIKAVGDYYGFSPEDLTGRNGSRDIAQARHVAMYLIAMKTDMSYTHMGRSLFSGRDHSSVSYALGVIDQRLRIYPELATAIQIIEENIKPVRWKSEGVASPSLYAAARINAATFGAVS